MKTRLPISKNIIHILILLLLSVCTRFLWISKIPATFSSDELTYAVTSHFIVTTGSDKGKTWKPINLLWFSYPKFDKAAELPYLSSYLADIISHGSKVGQRYMAAIQSIALVFIIYLLGSLLFTEPVGFIAALIATVNPWLIYTGRTLYEATPSMFWYLTALYLGLRPGKWMFIGSLAAYVLAFLSYIGTKTLIVPYMIVSGVLSYTHSNTKKISAIKLTILLMLGVGISIYYMSSVTHNNSATRINELFTPMSAVIGSEVDAIRKTSIYSPFVSIFTNRFTVYGWNIIEKFFLSISPGYLFLHGDQFFSFWNHGLFYLVDLVFLCIGILVLFNKNRKILGIIGLFIAIGTIPQLIHTIQHQNYSLHTTLTIPFLIYLIAYGIFETIEFAKAYKSLVGAGIFMVYVVSTVNFFYLYFYIHPIYTPFDFEKRIISSYINRLSPSSKVRYFTQIITPDIVKQLIFWTDAYQSTNLEYESDGEIKQAVIGKVTLLKCSQMAGKVMDTKEVTIVDARCAPIRNPSSIAVTQLKDSGLLLQIENDHLCNTFNLPAYLSGFQTSMLDVEKLNNEKFCTTYLVKYK